MTTYTVTLNENGNKEIYGSFDKCVVLSMNKSNNCI